MDTRAAVAALLLTLVALSVFDRVTEYVGGSAASYGIVFAVDAVDAFFPVVPGETVTIVAGALAADGDLLIWVVAAAAILGAFAGDNVSFWLGETLGERAAARFLGGEKARRRLEWADGLLDRHGASVIVVARFVPGGRTATTFAAGMLELPWRRFAAYDAVAATVWGLYASLLGYLGGEAFSRNLWLAIGIGFAIAVAVSGAFEGYRRVQRRRGRDIMGAEVEEERRAA